MKKALALLLALVMALALVACGGGNNAGKTNDQGGSATPPPQTDEPDKNDEPAPSGDKIDINVIAAEYGQNTKQWWADFVTDFNKDNEGIDLTVEVVSWNDIYTVVNTRISGNSAPDILNIDVFADYQADDLLLPAEEFVSPI